jgi:hypothetical protein
LGGVVTTTIGVSEMGQPTASANCTRKNTPSREDIEHWTHTYSVITDEISFSPKQEIQDIESNCRILKRNAYCRFGKTDIIRDVIFAGDITQLQPVQGTPIKISWKKVRL